MSTELFKELKQESGKAEHLPVRIMGRVPSATISVTLAGVMKGRH